MPELICIKHGDVSYCLDTKTGQFEIFNRMRVDIKDCPVEVIGDLLSEASKKMSVDEMAAVLTLIAQHSPHENKGSITTA